MESLLLSQDPYGQGGVSAMQREMASAHVRLGLQPSLAYVRQHRLGRFDLRRRPDTRASSLSAFSFGYVPTIEYLNYTIPGLLGLRWIRRFPIVQLVTGSHAMSAVPIIAGRPFVSWVATPFDDEVRSRYAANPSLSVKLNYRLRALNNALERRSYLYPGKVFALSNYTARRLVELTGLPRERFDVLHFPIDLRLYNPDGPRHPAFQGRYIVSAGRVDDARKNFELLLRCFAKLTDKHPDVSLVIAGVFETPSAVKQLTVQMGLADRVHFPGALGAEELSRLYRGAEFYAMTSRQEGLGIVVLEAQASGLPCVIMRCGGSDELINEGKNGFLVDQGDGDGFVRALDTALSDPDLQRRQGSAARKELEHSGSQEAFDRALSRAYESVFSATAESSPRTPAV